ncbi:MAG: flavin monoamine oxidase family protein [Bacteroidetes bacterium]|nr:MAG: flavin monoamine oxidase family protein [Bacteroidota bacterium]
MTTDIAIIGAGFAGLTAARQVKAAGLSFKILEARDRVGGRIHTHYLDDETYVDLGGQWIGPTQDKIYELTRHYGVSTFETYNQGKNILALNDRIKTYTGLIPKLSIPALLNLDFALKKLERLAKKTDLHAPWNTPDAAKLDAQTLATFLDKMVKFKSARAVMDAGLETVFAATPAEISLLFALFYIKSGTSLDCLLNIDNGAQQDRFIGGAQTIPNKMAAELGDDVLLEHPVLRIAQTKNGVEVFGEKFRLTAQKAIVAIPPPLAARIQYDPALPARRDQLTQRMPMGTVIKCYAIYDKPFWREQGFSGQAVTDHRFAVQTVFDNSPHDASKGMLMGFSLANRARKLLRLSPEERQKIILENFTRLFGKAAARPVYYIDKSWADEPWSRGCYTGILPPGVWTGFAQNFREPCGHLHWAGTETAEVWNGYIDGAIRSGERAAAEVIRACS